VCHEFAGRNVNVHHIIQECDGGSNTLDNAIALCFNCHAEAGHYNPNHPLGTKYSPEELRRHRDQWWDHCGRNPAEAVGCGIDVGYEKDSSSNASIHKYWLVASFTNSSPARLDGYVIEFLFPIQIPVDVRSNDYDIASSVTIGGNRFRRFTLRSNDIIYRDQTIQIVDRVRRPLFYRMNNALDDDPECTRWELRWNFYAGNMPAVREVRPWNEMHEF
jgi:hypothetical protein